MKTTYSELLKDPRWQKKRLEIFERDEWTCQICLSQDDTLHVHHRRYIPGNKPWDYGLDDLVTLCEQCHQDEKDQIEESEGCLLEQLRIRFFSTEIHDLCRAIHSMPMLHLSEVVMTAICWNIVNNQQELLTKYFAFLEKKGNSGKQVH